MVCEAGSSLSFPEDSQRPLSPGLGFTSVPGPASAPRLPCSAASTSLSAWSQTQSRPTPVSDVKNVPVSLGRTCFRALLPSLPQVLRLFFSVLYFFSFILLNWQGRNYITSLQMRKRTQMGSLSIHSLGKCLSRPTVGQMCPGLYS